MSFWYGLLVPFIVSSVSAAEVERISLPLVTDIQRADIYVLKVVQQPAGILVLCPGCNGNGKDWIQNPIWQDFARDHNLDLVGISFSSDILSLNQGKGYYYAPQGSGQLLLDGLSKTYSRNLPLLLYGFSGGAHFASSFSEWKADRVKSWCAYSAGWWVEPVRCSSPPPGLIICGEDDERYGASLLFYEQGRTLGKPWLWVSAPHTGHSIYAPAEKFVRDYFASILEAGVSDQSGEWVDIDHKRPVDSASADSQPSITGWLPNAKLLGEWQEIHTP